jgi:AcrR family transcriptional regulator
MPALPKTSDDKVVRAARKLLERQGELSMQAVAEQVGVRAPSLYKRFPDREALLNAVGEDAAGELAALIAEADKTFSPQAALTAMAHAYRQFALRSPRSYALLFAPNSALSVEARAAAVAPLMRRLDLLVGQRQTLSAARLVTAWLHGFVSMELAGAFRLGGHIDEAFDYGLTTLLSALKR